ncbi:MAG TPA: hypothetical protein VL126_13395 [Bacteroidota bacterium]|nr:hypothetical protein [Bacteroidota bacterium]
MTGAIVSLVGLYCLVIIAGKRSRRVGIGGIMFLGVVAAVQVAAVLFFVYSIKSPVSQ